MKPKKIHASAVFELLLVLLVTAIAFVWASLVAQMERGYDAVGGEYLLLLFPAVYYPGKKMILDGIADLQKRNERMKKKMEEKATRELLLAGADEEQARVKITGTFEGIFAWAKITDQLCRSLDISPTALAGMMPHLVNDYRRAALNSRTARMEGKAGAEG